jgi:hypothetical protein
VLGFGTLGKDTLGTFAILGVDAMFGENSGFEKKEELKDVSVFSEGYRLPIIYSVVNFSLVKWSCTILVNRE